MNRNLRTEAKAIFLAALDVPEGERERFIARQCGEDVQLRSAVEQMVRDDREAERTRFLLEPPDAFRQVLESEETTDASPRDVAREQGDFDRRHSHPRQIGPYRILEAIGEGGMGVVYLAQQDHPVRRKVAIKIIKLGMDTREVIGRFESERQALAMMNHTNIAKVFDAGATEQGRPYFVMEYVAGVPLTDYCDRHGLGTRERLQLFVPVCQAIQHAHQKGIIHRDVKPPNILVTLEDGKPVPKVIDFGVAKATNQTLSERTVFTEQGRLIGTPEYMSPEQAEMTGLDVDTTTDVYSLGVVLYELLVGSLPFEPNTLRKAGLDGMHRIIREMEPPTPSSRISTLGNKMREIAHNRHAEPVTLLKEVRGELDWITMRAIEKDRTRRYASASELASDILRYLQGDAVAAGPPSASYRLRKVLRRNRLLVGSLGAVFAALAFGMITSTALYFRAERARDREEQQARKATQITQFLQHMLSSVDPARQGRDVTVREVLDEAARTVQTDLASQPEVQASVQGTIGRTYMALGLYDLAEPQLRSALTTSQTVLGEVHPEVASSLSDLAALMREKGDYRAAELLLRDALEMDRKVLGSRDPAVATGLNDLALVYKDQGRYAQAESTCREALSLRRELLGDNHAEVAATLNNLASVLQAAGKYPEAETYLRQALATQNAVLGPNHPDVAVSLNNLGAILQAQGKYDEAAGPLREALALEKKLYGDQHPSVPNTISNLALVSDYQGRHAQAESLYREALDLYKPILGEKHQSIAACMNALSVLLQGRGEYEEAESLQRRALAMRRELLGDRNPVVAGSLCNLAALLQERGKWAEAEADYREALGIQEEALGPDHPRIASTLYGLGSLLTDRGNAPAAEPLLRRSLGIRMKTSHGDSWQVACARNMLGSCLEAQGRYVEAESLLTVSWPVIKGASALTTRQKQQALLRIIHFYDGRGQPGQAEVYRTELRSLSEGPR
jgi:eukaryotic-like serine/threonine-protein kinase